MSWTAFWRAFARVLAACQVILAGVSINSLYISIEYLAVRRVAGYNSGPILGCSSVGKSGDQHKGPGLLLISVGTMLTSMIAAGFLLGYFVDVWLDTLPIFMLVCGGLGFVGGILKVYRLLSDPNLQ